MTTKKICITALGVALYVCVSMILKIPLIAHISLDLGYIVLAVYCYYFGTVSGAIVGGFGALFVSLIASGWFPPGWILGNVFIGIVCGKYYIKLSNNCGISFDGRIYSKEFEMKFKGIPWDIGLTIFSVLFGIWITKTAVECPLYGIPVSVKLVSNGIAAITDAMVMCIGVVVASKLPIKSYEI